MTKLIKIREEVEIPKGITFTLTGKVATAKGKLGSITKDFNHARSLAITQEGAKIILEADYPKKEQVALAGTLRNIINNMCLGVSEGYTYKMKICFSHFPITVENSKDGKSILIKNYAGERSPRIIPAKAAVKVNPTKDDVILTSSDKEAIGNLAGKIQRVCRTLNKDKRVFQDGIYIYEKSVGQKIFWQIK